MYEIYLDIFHKQLKLQDNNNKNRVEDVVDLFKFYKCKQL